MLVDNITLNIKAGNGGNGASTFLRNGVTSKGGPDGGNGGNGGNIYFQGSSNIRDLMQFRFTKKVIADDGIRGKRKRLFGKNAAHTTILVPLGTEITELATGKTLEILNTTPVLLAQGGVGGTGTRGRKAPDRATPHHVR